MAQRSVCCLATSRPSAGRILSELKTAEISGTDVSLLYILLSSSISRSKESATRDSMAEVVSIPGEKEGGRPAWLPTLGPLMMSDGDPLVAAGSLGESLRRNTVRSVRAGLIAFGMPSAESERYTRGIDDGLVLIAVHTMNLEKSGAARAIFHTSGATGFTMMQIESFS